LNMLYGKVMYSMGVWAYHPDKRTLM
jgi:hypothetical protein